METSHIDGSLVMLQRRVRVLGVALLAALVLAGVAVGLAVRSRGDGGAPRELTVERLNVVEPDGTLRMVVSNTARSPGKILGGVEHMDLGGRSAGIRFFNEQGDETGGLGFESGPDRTASAGLLFDRLQQDQIIGITYEEEGGRYAAGLQVWDRPETPIAEVVPVVRMPDGPEKAKTLEAMDREGAFGKMRMFAGRLDDGSSAILLFDDAGRPRLRMAVDAAGHGRLEFLDAAGRVTRRYPE